MDHSENSPSTKLPSMWYLFQHLQSGGFWFYTCPPQTTFLDPPQLDYFSVLISRFDFPDCSHYLHPIGPNYALSDHFELSWERSPKYSTICSRSMSHSSMYMCIHRSPNYELKTHEPPWIRGLISSKERFKLQKWYLNFGKPRSQMRYFLLKQNLLFINQNTYFYPWKSKKIYHSNNVLLNYDIK